MKRIMSLAIGMLQFAFYSTASQAAITSLTVTSVTISKSTGLVTVSGAIQCTAGDTVFIDEILYQVLGGKAGSASGFPLATCTGGSQPWSTPQFTLFGSFTEGNADVIAAAFGSDGSSVPFTTFHGPITPVP
jgi:hypothetical protein